MRMAKVFEIKPPLQPFHLIEQMRQIHTVSIDVQVKKNDVLHMSMKDIHDMHVIKDCGPNKETNLITKTV